MSIPGITTPLGNTQEMWNITTRSSPMNEGAISRCKECCDEYYINEGTPYPFCSHQCSAKYHHREGFKAFRGEKEMGKKEKIKLINTHCCGMASRHINKVGFIVQKISDKEIAYYFEGEKQENKPWKGCINCLEMLEQVKPKLSIPPGTRPVMFKSWVGEKVYPGFFHSWGGYYEQFTEGVGNMSQGIVETIDGWCMSSPVETIIFLDRDKEWKEGLGI